MIRCELRPCGSFGRSSVLIFKTSQVGDVRRWWPLLDVHDEVRGQMWASTSHHRQGALPRCLSITTRSLEPQPPADALGGAVQRASAVGQLVRASACWPFPTRLGGRSTVWTALAFTGARRYVLDFFLFCIADDHCATWERDAVLTALSPREGCMARAVFTPSTG